MSAPISIPVGIEDTGSQSLGALASNFDNLYQQANKVSGLFADMGRYAQDAQRGVESLSGMFDTLTSSINRSAAELTSFNAAASNLSTITARTRELNLMADAYERVARSAGSMPSGAGPASYGGVPTSRVSSGSAYSASSISAMSNAERASLEAGFLQSDLNNLLAGGAGGALGNVRQARDSSGSRASNAHGGGGAVKSMLENMLLYGGAYGAYAGVRSAIGGAMDQSTALASETASLGLTYGQGQTLNQSSMDYAGSGGSIYNAAQLNSAAYVPYTYNTGGSAAGNLAITKQGARLAQALGGKDPTDAINSLALLGVAYGGGAKGAQQSSDILTQVTLSSAFDLPQIAANVGMFSSEGAARGISKSDLLSSYGITSGVYGPERAGQAAQDMSMLMRMLGGNANAVQRNLGKQIGLNLADPNLVQDSGGFENLLKSINTKTNVQGPAAQQQMLTAIFGPQAGLAITAMMNHGDFSAMDTARAAGVAGTATNRAYQTTQQFAGTQMQEAEVRFGTAVNKLATATLPELAKAVKLAADAISGTADIIMNLGKKTKDNPAGGTPFDTLAHFINPADPGFLNITKSKDEAARYAGQLPPAPEDPHAHENGYYGYGQTRGGGMVRRWIPTGTSGPSADPSLRFSGGPYIPGGTFDPLTNQQRSMFGDATPTPAAPSPGGSDMPGHAPVAAVGMGSMGAGFAASTNALNFAHAQSMIGVRGASTQNLKAAKDRVLNLIASGADAATIASAEADAIQVIMSQAGDPAINAHNAQIFDDAVQRAIQSQVTKTVRDAVTEINARMSDLQAGATLAGLEGNTALAAQDNRQINALRTANAGKLGLSANQLALANYQQLQSSGGVNPLTRRRQDLQNAVSMAQLNHNPVAERAAQQALYNFDVANPQGRDASDLALEHAQMLSQTKIATPGAQLIRSQETGLGDAIAGEHATVARLSRNGGAQDPLAETVKHLREMLAKDDRMIAELQKSNDHLVEIRDEGGAAHPATHGQPSHHSGTPRRLHGL